MATAPSILAIAAIVLLAGVIVVLLVERSLNRQHLAEVIDNMHAIYDKHPELREQARQQNLAELHADVHKVRTFLDRLYGRP